MKMNRYPPVAWRILGAAFALLVPAASAVVRAWPEAPPALRLPLPAGLGVSSDVGRAGEQASSPRIEVWRWRHGYSKSGENFFWLTMGDVRERMDPDDQALCESFLSVLLSSRAHVLGGGGAAPFLEFRQKAGAAPGVGRAFCRFNAWGAPVRLDFKTERDADGRLIPSGRIRWRYSRAEWRRFRGYRRFPWGSYRFSSEFPLAWGAREGARLDALMDRSVEYWVDVAVLAVLDRLSPSTGGRTP